MYNEIEAADLVLVVCTEPYQRRALGREAPGRGLGATWEGAILTQTLYDAQTQNDKFVPVVFSPDDLSFIPYFLRGATHYNVRGRREYAALHAYVTGRHETPMPPLGPIVTDTRTERDTRRVANVDAAPNVGAFPIKSRRASRNTLVPPLR